MLEELRLYQEDIVNQVVDTDRNTLIQIPTGGGKTVIAKFIAIDLINHHNKQVLFVAPKIVLMEQTMNTFEGLKPQIVHGPKKFDKNHHLFVSTIQTASRRELNPDVIIVDEIHYGYDGTMIEKLIKDKPNTRIIGLSATPYDRNGRLLNGFDLILNKYDMTYMINHGYLVPLRSFVLTRLVLDNVKVVAGDYDLNELGKIVCSKDTILEIVQTTKEYIEKSKKTIVFAVNIEHANLLAKAYEEVGFVAKSVHSKMKNEDSSKIINDFKKGYNNLKVLVSVLKLTTGFDVPDTDCAVIARPTKSQNLYKQMVGRILRLASGKREAILLDCGNVIDELGMPLDPIKVNNEPIQEQVKMKCSDCGSISLSLKKENDDTYWLCKDCGLKKHIHKNAYTCSDCQRSFNETSKAIVEDNRLYLNCECGNNTLISQIQGNEELVEIIDKKYEMIDQNYIDVLGTPSKIISVCLDRQKQSNETWLKFINSSNNIDDYIITFDGEHLSYFKKFYEFYACNHYANSKNLLQEVEEKFKITSLKFLKQFNHWCIKNDCFLDFEKNFLIKINREEEFELLKYFIELKYFPIILIIDKCIEYKLVNVLIFIVINYKKGYLDFNISDYTCDLESTYDISTNEIIQSLINKIQKIDIGECFSLIDFILNGDNDIDDDYILAFDKMIDLIMVLSKYFAKQGITPYLYGKKILNYKYLPFKKARRRIHQLSIKSLEDWYQYINFNTEREFNIPRYPNLVYSDWKGWSDWLNSSLTDKAENIQFLNENFIGAYNMVDPQLATVIVPMNNNKKENVKIDYSQYLSFEDAKEIIQKKNFQNKQEWYHFTKSKDFPTNIPHNPHEIYIKDGWINMDDWLGINIDTAQYLEIEEAKKIVHRLHLHSRDDWYSFTKVNKLPKNIPEKPHLVYKNKDWIDYQDWVGYDDDTYYKLKSHYLKFEVAKKYIHSLKFKSIFEWFAYIYGLADYPEVPNNIPRFPKKIYHDKGWNGLNDWLGIK